MEKCEEIVQLVAEEKRRMEVLADYIVQKQSAQAAKAAQSRKASPECGTNSDNVRHGGTNSEVGNRKSERGTKPFSAGGAGDKHMPADWKPGDSRSESDRTRYENLSVPIHQGTWRDIFVSEPGQKPFPPESITATADKRANDLGPGPQVPDTWDKGESAAGTEEPMPVTMEQSVLIERLLLGDTLVEAAERLRLSRRTIHRWLSLPEVAAELRRQQNEVASGFRNRVATWAARAVGALETSLKGGSLEAALGLLKGVGLLRGEPLSEIDGPLFAEAAESPAPVTAAPATVGPVGGESECESEGAVQATAAEQNLPAGQSAAAPDICDLPDTAPDERPLLEDLPVRQQLVIAHLLFGEEPLLAFCKARVRREVFQRWLREDPAFQHVLRACRAEMQHALQTQLVRLVPKAIEVIETALEFGNGRIALAVLRGLGLCGKKQPLVWCGKN